jgi:hypothetical protein
MREEQYFFSLATPKRESIVEGKRKSSVGKKRCYISSFIKYELEILSSTKA